METKHLSLAMYALHKLEEYYGDQYYKAKKHMEDDLANSDYWSESMSYWLERKVETNKSYEAFCANFVNT